MSAETKTKKKFTGKPTQAFLKIAEVKQDSVVMIDGTLRSVIAVSSTNFDLKNEDEQNALIYNYQRFLNSLDYPIQILMQSRKMDVSGYLDKLKTTMARQTNELLRLQTAEYIEFIDRLVESANVMNKNFYVIVSLNQSVNPAAGGFFTKLLGSHQVQQVTEREANFNKYKVQLDDRTSSIMSNLGSIGLRVVRLNTDQLIELMYNSYNFSVGPAIDASQLDKITIEQNNP